MLVCIPRKPKKNLQDKGMSRKEDDGDNMTHRETVRILHSMMEPKPYEKRINNDTYDALRIAVDAVDKRKPYEPILLDGNFYCPDCSKPLIKSEFFCSRCGKAIDWDEV